MVEPRDPAVRALDHLDGPGVEGAGSAGLVGAEGGTAIRRRGQEPGPPAADALAEVEAADLGGSAQPQRVRRHGEGSFVVEELDDGGDVVALEGVHVAGEKVPLLGVDLGLARRVVEAAGGEGGSGPLERAVDRCDAGVEELRHLVGVPAEDLPQDQHGPLTGWQVQQSGDEGRKVVAQRRCLLIERCTLQTVHIRVELRQIFHTLADAGFESLARRKPCPGQADQ